MDDIYAQHGPFGPAAEEQRERFLARMTPSELQKRMKKMQEIEARVRKQIIEGSRPLPSSVLIGNGSTPPLEIRSLILDVAAKHADRNGEVGRADQCVAFASYVRAMLLEIGISSRVVIGRATYSMNGTKHNMYHAWIETEDAIIDGNTDSFTDNPTIPNAIKAKPYWGSKSKIPNRELKEIRELLAERETLEIHDRFNEAKDEVVQDFKRLIALRPI